MSQCHIKCELLSLNRHMNGSCDKKVIECEKCGCVLFQSDKKIHQDWCDKSILDVVDYVRNEIIVKRYGEPSQYSELPNNFDVPYSRTLKNHSQRPYPPQLFLKEDPMAFSRRPSYHQNFLKQNDLQYHFDFEC
ncbi:hypothetical protein EDI_290940 [Entamoeba dispar SAW760]|uniref:Uncharacterized protein n=1 Tax=Entamoeba dispar (strain ATCC PRA-260 / SAW760) TaxID=370354 RepID=B0ECN9_ENTDS|nr:uncharacterized protein EDI_290940 [Entamoeba dispar SAW760]EDR27701.1 hypothetical protein EDI_290940 [Entamoeba dispar SAW760]|eukprot:EDR27701.1 hypothetical protein EDI_290940 [Entamoeba dispar SAW760]